MKKLIKYFVVLGVGLLISLLVMLSKNVFSQTDAKVVYHILSDAFFVSGTLLTCFGLLIFTSNQGSFDMLVYGFQMFINKFRKDINARKYKSFYEYREAKGERKKSFGYICLIGLCFIAISGIFIYLLNK